MWAHICSFYEFSTLSLPVEKIQFELNPDVLKASFGWPLCLVDAFFWDGLTKPRKIYGSGVQISPFSVAEGYDTINIGVDRPSWGPRWS